MFNNTRRSSSSFTLSLILFLTLSFLVPLYHCHTHAGDYHQEGSDEHVFFHDGPSYEELSANHQHDGPHLHIKKDIGSQESRLHFKGKTLKSVLHTKTAFSALSEHNASGRADHAQHLAFQTIYWDCPSGLSPPTV